MKISPPITVLAILAVGVSGTVWLAPPRHEAARIAVAIPAVTFQKLELLGKEHLGTAGRPLTAAQVIEELANRWDGNKESR